MQANATPTRVMGLYDAPLWNSLKEDHLLRLQRCSHCGAFRYPPGPTCHACLSVDCEWTPVSGGGEIVSWVIFHKQYLPAYPAPYNVIAVRLDEGPVLISNLEGVVPEGSWIGRRVRLMPVDMADGVVLPRFVLAESGGERA